MKKSKILMLVLAIALVLAVPVALAATPATVNTTAKISINKTLKPSDGNVFPNTESFEFKLEPVSYTLAEDGVTNTDTSYMPAGSDINVPVTLNANGTLKEGSKDVSLDFAGKKIGVYTYKLTEVNGGETGVTYDDMTYYVNVYVINQVDENGTPTGLVTVSDITAWEVDNMSDEALKALTADWNGALIDVTTNTTGKIAHSTDGNISYPFENSYATKADINLTKKVTGNYANTNQLFTYKITLDDKQTTAGQYTITYTKGADATAELDASNPTSITSGTTATVKLAHGQSLNIADLPSGTTYEIIENQDSTYSGKFATVDGGTADTTTRSGEGAIGANVTSSGTLADNKMENNVLADEDITYTNNKEYVAPTGIILNILPFVAGIAVVVLLLAITNRKRQED